MAAAFLSLMRTGKPSGRSWQVDSGIGSRTSHAAVRIARDQARPMPDALSDFRRRLPPEAGPCVQNEHTVPPPLRPASFPDVRPPTEPLPYRHRLERARAGPAHRPSSDPGAPLDQGRKRDPSSRRRLDHRPRRFRRGPSRATPRQRVPGKRIAAGPKRSLHRKWLTDRRGLSAQPQRCGRM